MRLSRRLIVPPTAVSLALVGSFAAESDESAPTPRLQPAASLDTSAVSTPDLPAVQTPDVPPVSTPDVPGAPPTPDTPGVAVPDVPAVSTPSAPSAPSVPGVRTPSGGGGAAGGGGSSSSSSSGSGATDAGGAGGSGAGSGAAAKRSGYAGERSSGRSRGERRRARERKFRARVERLRGCFGALSDRERRVLTLRAGLGGERPRSRGRVADELGVGRREVRSTERRALRRLGAANRAGGCGSGGGAATVSFATDATALLASGRMPRLEPAVLLSDSPPLLSASEMAADGPDGNEGEGEVAGVERSSDDEAAPGGGGAGDAGQTARLPREVTTVASAGGGASGLRVLWMALAAAITLMLLVALTMRRRDGQVATAGPSDRVGTAPAAPAATAVGAAATRERETTSPPEASEAESDSAPEASPGDPAAATASSPDSAAAPTSPGDPAAAPGPPAASAAAGAAVGATQRDDRTVVRRRSGGLVGAVKPAGEQAAKAASSATHRLREIARRARERRD